MAPATTSDTGTAIAKPTNAPMIVPSTGAPAVPLAIPASDADTEPVQQ